MPTGVFISMDGLDGTGKSTQARLLVDWLRGQGLAVTACTDPGGTELGAKLREILLFGREHRMSVRTEALLFMASRAELVEQVIRPALGRDEVVVSDRFTLANVVYQGYAGGLNPLDLWAVGGLATGDLQPDLTVVLDLPTAIAKERRGRDADRMESRGDDYFEKVREGFYTESCLRNDRIAVVSALPSVQDVQADVRRAVGELLKARGYPVHTEG
jgi:dTMP kinase